MLTGGLAMLGIKISISIVVLICFFHLSPNTAYAIENYCSPQPLRIDALDRPSKHAWDLFLTINHPAKSKEQGRGIADCSKPIGAPETTSVWETWRNADTEVYLKDGAEPPEWNDTSLPDLRSGQTPAAEMIDASGTKTLSSHMILSQLLQPQFSPDGEFQGSGGFGETRINKTAYNFIRNECLFSKDGLKRYANAVASGKKPEIKFPVEAIEVKAAWIDLSKHKIPKSTWKTYYIATDEKTQIKYGLTTLHIITKDIPNWFWASFHHKDVPHNQYETIDDYGAPSEVKDTVWSNYVLGGTQTDFITPTGEPTKLSDFYVESGFQNSSCITCHATAAISSVGSLPNAQRKALCAMTLNFPDANVTPEECKKLLGLTSFKPNSDELLFERGAPDPSWFSNNGVKYIQTDFVWSIPFRAKNEINPPPQRCIW